MVQSRIHIGDVGKLVQKVIDDWRFAERKAVRDRLRDFEERFEKLKSREPHPDTDSFRERLQQSFDEFASRVDAKYAMIDEAHRQMTEFVDQRGRTEN
ncbi:hypothetical protein ACI5KX_10750 [Erythrobacter sp. GH1-10]|uniref:hypothetical protein n=1 Tax=Erythrobacter sp. GH1-10 TaxID=3349334 RepID=UPI00387805C4